jgi:hypothetical protein
MAFGRRQFPQPSHPLVPVIKAISVGNAAAWCARAGSGGARSSPDARHASVYLRLGPAGSALSHSALSYSALSYAVEGCTRAARAGEA